ncbi:xanthine dehydrogenase molybdopterin binding subunit [Falsihalocynthiibacter sp. S25ZX9]|uniref:xanthine dehydrogenase molybdopterin binding subunit n=1 Tax=Falsihalocynthiibacter sp. S25ZX9 TaxID=3240870 RepID=UPI00350FD29A
MSAHTPLPHDAATLHVTGAARYVDDIPTPVGTLHLAFGLSTIACGKITSIDLTAVRAAEGVTDVLVAGDLPFTNDVSPSIHDEPLLAIGKVHYVGQPIFLVVAKTHLLARKAARLADITYAQTDALLTIDQALNADSRFEEGPRIYTNGNPLDALKSARHRVTGTIEMGGQEHFYLEGQAALAQPQDNGDMVVNSSTQHPTEIQHKVAEALGMPMHSVRVEIRRMGGGFGGKESQGNALAVACAIAAQRSGRPCKMRYDRDDDMIITGKRHDFRISYTVGFSDSGKIDAVDFLHLCRCGWAQDLSLPVADRAMLHADNAYFLPNVRIESHRLRTNTQSATAYRGFGGPQGVLGIERVLDHIAYSLGKDPLEVRRVNFYRDAPQDGVAKPTGQETPYRQKVIDCVINQLVDDLAESSDYKARRAAVDAWNSQNDILKKGLALTPVKFGISFTLTHLNQAGALVHIYQDGSVALNHGGTEMGQGLFQKVAQVAAQALGIPMERIRITATDTAKVPNTSATAASSGTDLNGMAVYAACRELRSRLAEFLAPDGTGVTFSEDKVWHNGTDRDWCDVVKSAYENRISLSATGFYKTPEIKWDRIAGKGRPFYYFAYGAAVSEVVIDRLTGENRILRTDILHDAGSSINPAIDIGQIEGGFVQGAGWLTTEELVWNDQGRLLTHAPSTYKIPACSDRPDILNVALFDRPNPIETISRSKAVGEPPFMHGISVMMALSDAIAACGATYPSLNAPATAEGILAAINRVRV